MTPSFPTRRSSDLLGQVQLDLRFQINDRKNCPRGKTRGSRDGARAKHLAGIRPRLSCSRAEHSPSSTLRLGFNPTVGTCITRRSEERRVGKECVHRCKFRGSPDHKKKQTPKKEKEYTI